MDTQSIYSSESQPAPVPQRRFNGDGSAHRLKIDVLSLPGLTPFAKVHALQLELVERRIRDEIPDTLIFCEHDSVVTRGRGLQFSADRKQKQMDVAPGIEVIDVERGGDLTWHGPGQLVVYPIFKLNGENAPKEDVGAWLRTLEGWISQVCFEFGIQTHTKNEATGVWAQQKGDEKKIASIGIALRRWVSFHGLALNFDAELSHFRLISPCGFSGGVMANIDAMQGASKMSVKNREHLESIFYTVISRKT